MITFGGLIHVIGRGWLIEGAGWVTVFKGGGHGGKDWSKYMDKGRW
jgi:hypothetical protein